MTKPEVLTPEWWEYFRDLGNRALIEACWVDIYAWSGGVPSEAEYFAPTPFPHCPDCGNPGSYGLNQATLSFDYCPQCGYPHK